MIVLNTPNRSIECVLSGAVTANQLPFVVHYINVGRDGQEAFNSTNGATNSTSTVTILGAPVSGGRRTIQSLSVFNADTASATITIRLNDNGTLRSIGVITLSIGDHLVYTSAAGWFVLNSSGSIKSTNTAVNLNDLGDVTITSPVANNVLTFNGSDWVNSATLTVTTVTVTGQIIISGAGAGQIVFPASQNASTNANTLDDYEEGTWTPALSFVTAGDLSVAYASRNGYYTKVGRLVTASFFLQTSTFTHTTASGNCQISGLPFANSSDTNNNSIGAMRWQGITKASYTNVVAIPESSVTYLLLGASGSGQAGSFVAAADMPTTGTVILAGTVTYNV